MQRTDENLETTTLIWFDIVIGYASDVQITQQKLRSINDYVTVFTDPELCIESIYSRTKEKIFLVTSGTKALMILSQISSLPQLQCVFIYCMKEHKWKHLLQTYPKIIGIYVGIEELCPSIKEQIDQVNKDILDFSIFDKNQKATKDLSEKSGDLLWFQLFHYIITSIRCHEKAKKEMIDVCRRYYRGNKNELEIIDEFEREYSRDQAIRWYTRQSFVYKLINKALRTEDIKQLQVFRFFIADLSQSLALEHKKLLSSETINMEVYRGNILDKEEYAKLAKSLGKVISPNGYLSTSLSKERAIKFASKSTTRRDVVRTLFIIDCDVQRIGTNVVYADVHRFSAFPDEEEVLFDLNASFEIQSISENGELKQICIPSMSSQCFVSKLPLRIP